MGRAFWRPDGWWSDALPVVYGYSLVWLVVGYVASKVRPRAPMGLLMMLFGIADLLGTTGNTYIDDSWGIRALRTLATIITLVQMPWLMHMVLTYPDGRAHDRATGLLVRALWTFAVLVTVARMLTVPRPKDIAYCAQERCTDVLAYPIDNATARHIVGLVAATGWTVMIAAIAAVLIRRWWRAP